MTEPIRDPQLAVPASDATSDAGSRPPAQPWGHENPKIAGSYTVERACGYGHLRAVCGRLGARPRWCWKHRPGPDPRRSTDRSEGCREATQNHQIRSMSTAGVRRNCPADHKRELLDRQGFVCVYCAEPFGSVVSRPRGRMVVTSVHYDHAVPLAYLNANPRWNWVAACNICNAIKAAKLIPSISEIRMHVLGVRDRKGYKVNWVPPVSSEFDPERWAVSFATFLSGLSYWDAEKLQGDPVLKQHHFKTALGTALSDLDAVVNGGLRDDGPPVAWASGRKGPWPWST